MFSELWPFENLGILNLSARYLENYLSWGLETWSTDTGWWVDFLIKLKKLEPVFVKHYAPNICFPKYGEICTEP